MTTPNAFVHEFPPLHVRLSRLLHPAFLIALAALIVNDWLLKSLLHNPLTGKLSDFAGVFAFAFFWSIVAGRRTTAIHALTAIAFAIWKSPLSQPAIDAWNALGLMQIARAVDASDLLAIAMLPLSHWLATQPSAASIVARAETNAARFAKFAIAGIALVAFTATSKQFDSAAIEADYLSAHAAKKIGEIAERDDADKLSAHDDQLIVRFEMKDCDEARAFFTAHAHGTQTVLRLRTVAGTCSGEGLERDTALATLDPVMAKTLSAQRVKAGMGALGEPTAMTTPAGRCPAEADRASRKPKRANDGDDTYPPKKRARNQPDRPPEQVTDPAASPETPSPSATRNSN